MDSKLIIYLVCMNILAFILMTSDKRRAVKKRGRIPESLLLFTALVGGCAGSLMGMLISRHKTRHPKFYIGVPLITAAYTVLAVLLLK